MRTSPPPRGVPALRRWELWEIRLDGSEGREQAGVRPCIVISRNAFNLSGLETAVVCPLTTVHRASFVWRPRILVADVAIAAADWKAKESWIQTDQIVTIDVRRRALRHVATLTSSDRRSEIETRLKQILGLD